MKQAVILAGGMGTRLRSRTGALPKALVEIGGVPVLGHQLRLLREHGFAEAVLLAGYGAEAIRAYCEATNFGPLRISFLEDGQPRGTAGAVLKALPYLNKQFAVLYGDTMLNVDLTRFWQWHGEDPNAVASLFLHPNAHPHDSDLVEVDEEQRVVRFHAYPHPEGVYLQNLVNAALYVMDKEALTQIGDVEGPLDFGKHLFPELLRRGQVLRGYISPEYIKDAGTPDRLDSVCRDYESGAVARSSLQSKQKAVLMDRDGTLNQDTGFIKRAEDLQVFEFVGPALRRLNESEWRTVVITNQPVLARGETTAAGLRSIHAKLDTEVARSHAYFDRLFYCPHHPDSGFAGEVRELKMICACRKPAPGLIHEAERELNLDLAESWLIGDTEADIRAAAAAGVRSILVETGSKPATSRLRQEADFVLPDFAAAVEFIIDVYPRIAELKRSGITLSADVSTAAVEQGSMNPDCEDEIVQ